MNFNDRSPEHIKADTFSLDEAIGAGNLKDVVQYMDVLNPRKQTGLIRAFPFVLKHINTVD